MRLLGRSCSGDVLTLSDVIVHQKAQTVVESWQLPSCAEAGCSCSGDLLASSDVPVHQKVPFIVHGYRPAPAGLLGLLRTVFALHNETGNMWTHLLGFGYFIVILAQLFQEVTVADSQDLQWDLFWVLALVISSAFCLICSFAYHLCLCSGPSVKDCTYRMDLTGIVTLIIMSYFTGIALGYKCWPGLRQFYLAYATCIALALAAPLLRSRLVDLTRHFIGCAALGIVPAVHFLCISSAEDVACVVPYLAAMFGCYGAGAWFFINRWPEKHWPGRFDFFGHSHQVWHIFVLLAAVSWVRGSVKMLQHFRSLNC
mmetsp:Transcript_60488/g.194768  ORF Transcript_60488/g.194768 Transcript_60488/m.194768 type:complete len:313 (+) Transcript_60488:103-1041(+)